MKSRYDVVILGAGHNGLVAASYLGRAGLSVLLLEKNDYIGGATTSQKVFPDYNARLSRYSYLVSLLPEKIIRDLGLKLELRRRATGSFTPYRQNGQHSGLLLSNVDEEVGRRSMAELTGGDREFEQMQKFYHLSRVFAERSWDSMLEPLVGKEDFRRRFNDDDVSREAWRSLAEEPLGWAVERYLQNDLVRGLVLTDAKIGVLTHPHDPSLLQNRCFIYHLIGNKTGEWKVPVGGMGAVARELEEAARRTGAELLTNVRIRHLGLNGTKRSVELDVGGKKENVEARFLLVNFGRNVLAKFTGKPFQPNATDEGSVFKINMLLRKLPKLKAKKYAAAQAWCGTFHSDEGYEQMNASYACASQGRLPEKTPCEVYCHTLTDDSILEPGLTRTRLSHDDALRPGRSLERVFTRQCQDAKRGRAKIPRQHEPVAGGTDRRLSRRRPRRFSLHRKQKPSRYRRLVRNVSRQYFSRHADVAIRDYQKGSRHLGR